MRSFPPTWPRVLFSCHLAEESRANLRMFTFYCPSLLLFHFLYLYSLYYYYPAKHIIVLSIVSPFQIFIVILLFHGAWKFLFVDLQKWSHSSFCVVRVKALHWMMQNYPSQKIIYLMNWLSKVQGCPYSYRYYLNYMKKIEKKTVMPTINPLL